jgi:putative methyltransferase (TIGR01177 family)
MNEYILVLKGTNKDLATYEFETLWKVYFNEDIKLKQLHNVYYTFKSKNLINISSKLLKRLTYTNKLCLKKFEGNFKNFNKEINNLDLEKYDSKKFAVSYSRFKKEIIAENESKELAKPIFNLYKTPIVDLKNPDIVFFFFYINNSDFIFTELIYENDKDYLRRMPKFRPVAMPYTLKSDMARGSINLLGLKEGIVLDPFCGIGGILLEAYDMNFEIIGNDISWNDLKYFKENFKYFYPDAKYTRILADSKTQFLKDNTIDGIVTDIPYGRASRKLGTDLYENFLISSKKYLKKDALMIIIYANFVEFKELALKYFKEEYEINQFINKSMTRHILVLKNIKK